MTATRNGESELPRLARDRLHNLHITGRFLNDPVEVVQWHGAMQAQDFAGSKWAIGLRLPGITDGDIGEAFNQGKILRTHVLRPTWHFVSPTDIRWMLELTGPRVIASARSSFRREGLDDETIAQSQHVIRSALAGSNRLTRAELSTTLQGHGLALGGPALGLLLMRAELDGLTCSGPLRGKQHTYALLEERVAAARSRTRQEALVELTRRYFTSHGPATIKDFAWWSGLTVRDIRLGIAELGSELERVSIDGADHWYALPEPVISIGRDATHLLPNYDEYIVGFANRDAYWHPTLEQADISRGNPLFHNTIVHDGKIVGTWTRNIKRDSVAVSINPFAPLSRSATDSLRTSLTRYGQFIERPVQLD